jgi:hypothetical protein
MRSALSNFVEKAKTIKYFLGVVNAFIKGVDTFLSELEKLDLPDIQPQEQPSEQINEQSNEV